MHSACLLFLIVALCVCVLPSAQADLRSGPGAQDMDMSALLGALGSMNRGANNKKPAPPKCPNGHVLVQNSKPLESNGCSKPAFMKIDGEEDFTYCCDRHDACYQICGINKQFCEDEFRTCLYHMCDTTFAHNSQCHEAKDMYVMGVTVFGTGAFEQSQSKACQCMQHESVVDHYRALVSNIYDKHAPEKKNAFLTEKFDKFAANTGSAQKPNYGSLQRLYLSLHSKYDDAIKHTETRVNKQIVRPQTPPDAAAAAKALKEKNKKEL